MSNKRILMVIAPQDFRDEELYEPLHYFQAKQWDVTIASTQTGTATAMLGKHYDVTETLDNKQADAYDALVVVGGMGSPTYLWTNETLLGLCRSFNEQQKVVSAICLSGAVLANAGILNGKRATVWEAPESIEAFEKGGATFVKEDVVTDGHIVTSPGPHAATPFAEAIASQLAHAAVS